MNDLYCHECGCEIRTPDEIGVDKTHEERLIGCRLGKQPRPVVEVRTIICRSCIEERQRACEAFTRSEAFRVECMINRTMREDARG